MSWTAHPLPHVCLPDLPPPLLQWDASILSNRRALLELEEELRRVARGQESLEKKLQVGGGAGGTAEEVLWRRYR